MLANKVLRKISPSHFPFKSAGSVSFTHTFHLSKFIHDVAFMTKKKNTKKEEKTLVMQHSTLNRNVVNNAHFHWFDANQNRTHTSYTLILTVIILHLANPKTCL